ncbi:hypothetical protein JL721_4298 [Aureococcus anophagefferens]|nr:hypothetical protein JL721_4298 [Aureococcus anophagefferens]
MQKLDSGVRYIDLKEGAGAGAGAGSKMTLQWVLRRSNGYFVSSSFGQLASGPDGGVLLFGDPTVANKFEPFIFTLAFSLPLNKSPGPVPDDFGSKRQIERELQRQDPYNYFLFEVEATNVR